MLPPTRKSAHVAPLKPTSMKLYPYGSSVELPIRGRISAVTKSKAAETRATFYVSDVGNNSLSGYDTAKESGLIKIAPAAVSTDPSASTESNHMTTGLIQEEYADLFTGVGKLKNDQIELHVEKSFKPAIQPHRRVPFHLRKKLEEEMEALEKADIIEKVEGPTTWVSPVVVASKPKNPAKMRLCVGMSLPSTTIKRERHLTPTMDDVISELNGSTIFSKLDLDQGYHQLELKAESRYITTFTTRVGLRRYKRLNFGISSAAEVFQEPIHGVIHGKKGALHISDDIIFHGKDQREHDIALRAVLNQLRKSNLTLNKAKCEFHKEQLKFFGNIFSARGMSPDPRKVAVVKHASPPSNVSELYSLLGMASYCPRFIPDFAAITHPLCELTKKNIKWAWD